MNRNLKPTDLQHAAAPAAQQDLADWPSFSIVVPTYQRRELACDAIRLLCELSYDGEVELIVIVDGSTDGTLQALARIECPFPLRIIEQPNQGASEARNRGAAEARNDIILFLDDDMMCEPDLVQQHARLHREGADAVIGDTPIDPASPPGFLAESVGRWIASTRVENPLSPFDIFTGQLSVRGSVFEALGGSDAGFTTSSAFGNEDADFGVRLLAGYDVRHNPSAISRQRYVVSPRDFMERASAAAIADLRFIRKHPQLTGKLFEAKGRWDSLARFIYRPMSRIPLVPEVFAWIAVWLAEAGAGTRFGSNRLLARFFSGSRSLAYWSSLRESGWFPGSSKLLVLCYHAIQDQSDDPVLAPYGVPHKLFVEHLKSLTNRGFTFISPDMLAAFLSLRIPLPNRAVLLTFDDCYPELLALAREVLQPLGIEAIAFAVTGLATGTNEWDQAYGAKKLALLGPDQLRELRSLGVEIGSHSRSHREMPLLNGQELVSEAGGSMAELVSNGLPRPRFFAYPYGSVDAAAKQAIAGAGFMGAFTLAQRQLTIASDPHELPRVIVLAKDQGWRFRFKTAAPLLSGRLARIASAVGRRLKNNAAG